MKTTRIDLASVLAETVISSENVSVVAKRQIIADVLAGKDSRLLVIVGPCSIHDEKSALEYAEQVRRWQEQYEDVFYFVMRTYFEKPRTTIGWTGFLKDPCLDESYDLEEGIRRTRALLEEIISMGVPVASEFLDPFLSHTYSKWVSYGAIGARTVESQVHRQLASILPMPVGMKNATSGDVTVAVNAIDSAKVEHLVMSLDENGHPVMISGEGNSTAHLILRGGAGRPNYDTVSVSEAMECLCQRGLSDAVVVDCSHANSRRIPTAQKIVFQDVFFQRFRDGNDALRGVMIEGHLKTGKQSISAKPLSHGVSVTDGCLGVTETEEMLDWGARYIREWRLKKAA